MRPRKLSECDWSWRITWRGKGVSFREAHETVGRIVKHAMSGIWKLIDLSLDELRSFRL